MVLVRTVGDAVRPSWVKFVFGALKAGFVPSVM